MSSHLFFSHDDVLGIHDTDGTTISTMFVRRYGLNIVDGIGSISYQIIILTIMKTSIYFILPIFEGTICIYAVSSCVCVCVCVCVASFVVVE